MQVLHSVSVQVTFNSCQYQLTKQLKIAMSYFYKYHALHFLLPNVVAQRRTLDVFAGICLYLGLMMMMMKLPILPCPEKLESQFCLPRHTLWVCLCVCQHDNFRTSKHRMTKLGGRCFIQKSRPSSNLGVIVPAGMCNPQNCGILLSHDA